VTVLWDSGTTKTIEIAGFVGTWRVPDQCHQIKDLAWQAYSERDAFQENPDYELIEQADEAQAKVAEVQQKIDALDAEERGDYDRLNEERRAAGELERQLQDYEEQVADQGKSIDQLTEDLKMLASRKPKREIRSSE
jgi:predicted nuclease with TOPRIM domain